MVQWEGVEGLSHFGQHYWSGHFIWASFRGSRKVTIDIDTTPDGLILIMPWLPSDLCRWGVLQFADGPLNETDVLPYPDWTIRHVAMSLYDAQREFHDESGVYASRVADLEPFAAPGTLDASCTGRIRISLSDGRQQYVAEVQSSAT